MQRAELHKTIWSIADDLRGSVDGWDFKQYVLGMLFYRFISENLCEYLRSVDPHPDNFDYAKLSDEEAEWGRAETVDEKGFFILPSELFVNVLASVHSGASGREARLEVLNETLERVFKNIEASAMGHASENDLKGLFDDMDVSSAKLGNTVIERNRKLATLLEKIASLNFGGEFKENRIDAFGDAYEYLMNMYASNAGKSGGEFFTPQDVSELLARITLIGRDKVGRVYDPCCGSGSLLLKFSKVAPEPDSLKYFGQEINLTTYNLCRINMFLHDINYSMFDIALGDTLKDPAHWDDEPFDCIVSNPPYSIKWEGKSNPILINDPRFSPAGVLAPESRADLAFTMHMLSWLATDGTAAIVEFPGVLYRGGAEKKIRSYLISNNFIDAVIQLPKEMFFGTSIATCIIVLKKSKADNDVLFINASEEFVREGTKNTFKEAHIRKILNTFERREEIDHFSKRVPNDIILSNDANMSVTSYVEAEDVREVIDIAVLNDEIRSIVARENELRAQIDAIVADLEGGSA